MNVQKTVKMKKHARKAIRVPRNKIGPEGKRKKGWKITEDPHFCPVFDGRPEFVYHPARMLSRNIVGVWSRAERNDFPSKVLARWSWKAEAKYF
jgi:hypothetical protein